MLTVVLGLTIGTTMTVPAPEGPEVRVVVVGVAAEVVGAICDGAVAAGRSDSAADVGVSMVCATMSTGLDCSLGGAGAAAWTIVCGSSTLG